MALKKQTETEKYKHSNVDIGSSVDCCSLFGVWCALFGVWYALFGVWCALFGVWCALFVEEILY
ncbi:hypothetical protein HX004_05760 [Myroides sp. 1354]|uniref:hypothetical protein n=1 Tax=unclassified Myroides TaxID=2642485 RepID=UPI002576A685|nr:MULTISPECIES: hypothetical protein [unclassified Myroides]MDM1044568.1 hypothetical protein [Myroides sp. R163-1]MDM1055281.1 hypothetical protein [Myroides sp. 1354]MDM1068578.1 hypothetical protein [Myroides sp. 1372]